MSHHYDAIIIGGGYSGITAANRLPRGTRVALIDPKADFIHRVRLHEYAAGGAPRIRIPLRRMLKHGAEHHRSLAQHVEPGLVRLADGNELRARHILVTTGSHDAAPGSIASYAAATMQRERLAEAAPGTDVVVRGAGLTGIEFAAELAYRRADLTVHLLGRAPVGEGLPERARDHLRTTLEHLGVHLDSEAPGDALTVDATGLRVSRLGRESSLAVSAHDQLLVAPTLESVPGIWGAGDAVRVTDMPHLRASCATAIPMGAHAADNIARALRKEPPTPFDFGYAFRCISLGRRRGIILSVDPLDTPTGRFMTGLAAAWFKSAVCASVIQAPTTFARTYRWPHASRETR